MPNWCTNDVTIWGLEEQPAKDLIAAAEAGKLLQWIAPMPEELEDTKAPSDDGINWYNWRVNKWGTKWDVSCHHIDLQSEEGGTYTVELSFDSAWSPPIQAFEVLQEKYPDIDYDIYYFEPGCDYVGCNGDDFSPYQIYQDHKDGIFIGHLASELADRFGFLQDYYDDEDEIEGIRLEIKEV